MFYLISVLASWIRTQWANSSSALSPTVTLRCRFTGTNGTLPVDHTPTIKSMRAFKYQISFGLKYSETAYLYRGFQAPFIDIVPVGWLEVPSCAYVTLSFRIFAFARAIPVMNAWKHKDKGRPRGRLHSDAQVSIRVRKHRNCVTVTVCD